MKFYRKGSLFGSIFSLGLLAFVACSTAKKKNHVELSELEGKKIALVSIEGEETSKSSVEVALVNQLVRNGTFLLVSKQDLDKARDAVAQDPTDWKGLAKRAGADYALRVQVLDFEAPVHEGYSAEEVEDSQLAEEMGTDGKTKRIFKVKSMEGHVRIQLSFTELKKNQTTTGIAEAQDRIEASARASGIHLPPKLRFLEKLTNQAFSTFFEQYH